MLVFHAIRKILEDNGYVVDEVVLGARTIKDDWLTYELNSDTIKYKIDDDMLEIKDVGVIRFTSFIKEDLNLVGVQTMTTPTGQIFKIYDKIFHEVFNDK